MTARCSTLPRLSTTPLSRWIRACDSTRISADAAFDGRELAVPLEWFPRLRKASVEQLARHRLIGDGIGICWPDLDEDLSVEGLLATR